ncbi:DNA repair protein RecN [Leptolyngbya valderiana BDU 20041]|nr:DNA repair protein RecN [Geitlerinema sp. CS-897]OAB55003.1 DNA repair protein RecN [Leptolyngbya valderiana BDU 20041]PPT08380.1 DNA repair protein RecN [Geitlerinema sp. FC II]
MLLRLQIENFALIDSLDLEFGRGLNVLTGETGAGKSIVLDALDAVLGGKTSRRAIRTGADRACIEATFALEGGIVACRRDLIASRRGSRSKYRFDGRAANQKDVLHWRDRVVEIAAQGQAVQLGQTPHQRELLDLYGGTKLLEVRDRVATAFDRWQQAEAALAERRERDRQQVQQLDLWTFQLEELENAQLNSPDELDDLEREAQRLSHVVELQQQSYRVYQALYDSDDDAAAASDLLGDAEAVLDDMVQFDDRVESILTLVREALVRVEEAGQQINAYADDLEVDPERLQAVNERVRHLKQICRKYGPTLADAIDRYRTLQGQLEDLDSRDRSVEALEGLCQSRREELHAAGQQLTQLRRQAAKQLESRLVNALKPLAMEKVKFQVEIAPIAPNRTGSDRVTFLLSANPGEPLQPLSETASGGEMSRFLLALKACFSEVDNVATLVFDEIDVGVSGRVAGTIAETLYRLSQHHQVLCVTHQPLVAAMADRHFHVAKQAIGDRDDERTIVSVRVLDEDQRRRELAQLASGQGDLESTDSAASAFADELLDRASEVRSQLKRSHAKAIDDDDRTSQHLFAP